MRSEKEMKKNLNSKSEKNIKPGDIKGKIEVADRRERRDGPGGN